MQTSRWARRALLSLVVATPLAGCAHGVSSRTAPLSPAAQGLNKEAAAVGAIANEEDLLDARFLYQALPPASGERARLRLKMMEYLLGPLLPLDGQRLPDKSGLLGSEDDVVRIYDSLRDAIELVPGPDLWRPEGLALSDRERVLLATAARLVVSIYSPRGSEVPVATGLFVLQVVDPTNAEWATRIDELLAWVETSSQLAMGAPGSRNHVSMNDVLEGVAASWPSPQVVDRIAKLAQGRQERLANILRRPLGTGSAARGVLGDLLIDNESLTAMAVNVAAFYLRAGQVARAAESVERFADKPGDDPDLRQLLAAVNSTKAQPADFLALARRFLPRSELLQGTSADRLDPMAAAETLNLGLLSYPKDSGMLVLASRVARFVPAPFLALRHLDEALAALEQEKSSQDTLAEVTAERFDLAYLRFKAHVDPEKMDPVLREAESLRAKLAVARQRFGKAIKLQEEDIDLVVARGLIDSGRLDDAQPLLDRAKGNGESAVDLALVQGNLALRRGDAAQAATLLREAIETRERSAPAEETIGYVEGQARLAFALGNAHDVAGNAQDARQAWRIALRNWERLRIEQVRRKSASAAAESTFEVGRLTYLMGKRDEAFRAFDEAIDFDEDRDQSYVDAIAFLVERGEADAALDIYRRALSKPNRQVSEYVKVYASLWVLDLSVRSTGTPDATAEAYLKRVESRSLQLRPTRAAAWYLKLARYAIGRLSYDQLLGAAATIGQKAEIRFYEAMHRLQRGRNAEANQLWKEVLDSKMVSFFEYEMAARYLRVGAPSRPTALDEGSTI
jgi:hypothetical protein